MSTGTALLRKELKTLESNLKVAIPRQRNSLRVKIRSLEKDITILEYAKEHMNILA